MNRISTLLFLLFTISGIAQGMELTLPERQATEGENIQLAIKAKNFTDIVSVQFSLAWDSTVVKYVGFEEAGLKQVGIGDRTASSGQLRFSWFDVQGIGINLVDESDIVLLNFEVIGEEGEATDITFVEEPLPIQIFQGTSESGVFTKVDLTPNAGLVEIVSALSYTSDVGQINCFGESSGFININIAGETDNLNISWTGPDGFSSSSLSLNELNAGDYQLVVSDQDGNTLLEETFSITAPLSSIALDEINTEATACGEASGTVNFQVSGGNPPYQYDIGNGVVDQSEFTALDAGQYTVIITDANNCQINQNFQIEAPDVTPVDLGDDVRLCAGESLSLEAGTHLSYEWSTGSENPSIDVETSGSYSVTVSDGAACVSSDTVQLIIVPSIELEVSETSFKACQGEPVILRVSGGENYQWMDTSNTLVIADPSQPIATPAYTTSYSVMAVNECSSDTATFEIEILEITANAGLDTCIAQGATVELNATGGVTYEWAEGNYTLSDYTIANPSTQLEDSTNFVVLITDENGCKILDSVSVVVAADPLQFVKRINMLSPNGDDKNDVLQFNGIEKYGFNQLTIYNRWGDVVYQKLNYQNDEQRFDGTFKGKRLPAGTYYYVLAFQTGEIKQALVIVYE